MHRYGQLSYSGNRAKSWLNFTSALTLTVTSWKKLQILKIFLECVCHPRATENALVGCMWLIDCCNLSFSVALIAWFTTNGVCVKNNNIYMWREQAIIQWSRWVISIVVCYHSVKLCALAAQDFRSQQNGVVTRMRRLCCVKPSQKERAIGVVRCKKEGMLLQPFRWRSVDFVIHHEGDVREEQQYIYVA